MNTDLEALERLLKTFNDEDSINIATPRLRRILARLKAAEEWYEARQQVVKGSIYSPRAQERYDRLLTAEAALIAVHEEDGNG